MDDATRATTAEAGGGGGAPREYRRDPKGSHTGGQFTANPSSSSGKPTTHKPAHKPASKAKPATVAPSLPARGQHGKAMSRDGHNNDPEVIERAQLSTSDINDLPDSAFAYIEPGGSKDSEGRTVPRSLRHFPCHDESHVRNALSRAPESPFGDKAMPAIRKAAKRMGIEVSDDTERSTPMEWGYSLLRSYPLEACEIRRGGNGRQVEAYAAIWDTPAEVHDHHGHYMERISRTAFDKTIRERGDRIPVFYNHGMNVAGSPSDRWSVPIGRSLEVRAESRGLWTLSQYNEGPDADQVLEAIRNGAITSQSFRGRVYKSDPMRVPKTRAGADLPMVTRTELGLTEFGPTPTAVYDGAAILALRSRLGPLATLLGSGYDLDRLVELARNTSTTPEEEPETDSATSTEEAGTEEPQVLHSGRQQSDIARKIQRARILMGVHSGPEEA